MPSDPIRSSRARRATGDNGFSVGFLSGGREVTETFWDHPCPPRRGMVGVAPVLDAAAFCSYTSGVLTWDEPKRQANLRRHGLDFEGSEAVFDGAVATVEDSRRAYGEQRINLLGWLQNRVVHMTYTERGEKMHVISLREATKHEARLYFKVVSQES